MEVQNVLYDPKATVNLISITQLNNEGWTAIFLQHYEGACLILPQQFWYGPEPCSLSLSQVNNVFMLTPIEVDIAEQTNTTF
eukprot:3043098-Rhodomonas_salina.1